MTFLLLLFSSALGQNCGPTQDFTVSLHLVGGAPTYTGSYYTLANNQKFSTALIYAGCQYTFTADSSVPSMHPILFSPSSSFVADDAITGATPITTYNGQSPIVWTPAASSVGMKVYAYCDVHGFGDTTDFMTVLAPAVSSTGEGATGLSSATGTGMTMPMPSTAGTPTATGGGGGGLTGGGGNCGTTTFDITAPNASDRSYTVNGVGNSPTLTLVEGCTYTFNIDTNAAHPTAITSDTNAMTLVSTGITNNQGITNGVITFTPTSVGTLFYECITHGFFGTIDVVTTLAGQGTGISPNDAPPIVSALSASGVLFAMLLPVVTWW